MLRFGSYLLIAITFLILMFASMAAPLSADELRGMSFYVSPSGDDNNAGSETKPFATLETA